MKKKFFLTLAICFCFVSVLTVTALAAHDYDFSFDGEYVGSMNSTDLKKVEKRDSAFVNPSKASVPTNYFLSTDQKSYREVTNIITNVTTSGKRSFTYYDGYGGLGNRYCLSGYPTHWDYTPYSISGTWSP